MERIIIWWCTLSFLFRQIKWATLIMETLSIFFLSWAELSWRYNSKRGRDMRQRQGISRARISFKLFGNWRSFEEGLLAVWSCTDLYYFFLCGSFLYVGVYDNLFSRPSLFSSLHAKSRVHGGVLCGLLLLVFADFRPREMNVWLYNTYFYIHKNGFETTSAPLGKYKIKSLPLLKKWYW